MTERLTIREMKNVLGRLAELAGARESAAAERA